MPCGTRYTSGGGSANRERRGRPRLVFVRLAPQALDAAAFVLGRKPPLARRPGRLGGAARLGRQRRAGEQLARSRARVLAVALLRTEAMRGNDQHARVIELSPGQGLEAPARGIVEKARAAEVVAQLHRALDLVDVLPARAARADEMLFERGLVDRNIGQNHGLPVPGWGLAPG